MRDADQQCVVEQGGAAAAILVLDETGFRQKGQQAVGGQRQDSGTAGTVANCPVGVLLAYGGSQGQRLLDRRVYRPEGWASDPHRRAAAKVPETVAFAPMPHLARALRDHAWAPQIPPAWITADERSGGAPPCSPRWQQAPRGM